MEKTVSGGTHLPSSWSMSIQARPWLTALVSTWEVVGGEEGEEHLHSGREREAVGEGGGDALAHQAGVPPQPPGREEGRHRARHLTHGRRLF